MPLTQMGHSLYFLVVVLKMSLLGNWFMVHALQGPTGLCFATDKDFEEKQKLRLH